MVQQPPEGSVRDRSAFITDLLIGLSDGLIVPFALTAGLSAVFQSGRPILVAGLVSAFAGAIAMGLGRYLGGRSEARHVHPEHDHHASEILSSNHTLPVLGLDTETEQQIAAGIREERERLTGYQEEYHLIETAADPAKGQRSGFNIALCYALGGLIPVAPYIVCSSPREGLVGSAVLTLCCLFLFGFFKAKYTGQNPWIGALRSSITGLAAAGAAFMIARLLTASEQP